MQFSKSAQRSAESILEAFRAPDNLPAALAPIFLEPGPHAAPCRGWSYLNQILVALAGTADARGYKQWQAAGRHVKKGAKATYILAPNTRTVTRENDQGEEEKAKIITGFRGVPVFRLEDTEGEPLARENDPAQQHIDGLPLRAVADAWGVDVAPYAGKGQRALGVCMINIASNQPRAIRLGVENVATWLHELCHAADAKLGNLTERGQHWRSETVAELGSAILATCLGIDYDADLGGCYRYVEGYASAAGKSVMAACLEVLDRTCKAVGLIMETAAVENAAAA